jgi:hypothetical protein
MKFMLLVYTDSALIDALPEGQMDGMLRTCFDHVDELHREGHLIESQMLDGPRTRSRCASGTTGSPPPTGHSARPRKSSVDST